ncbi:MAG: hypothetical protein M1827_002014 [Pycnora praestabilis]|nr:MAG: hypothetical protein M1827_002014 [Pycnora praestabilis]
MAPKPQLAVISTKLDEYGNTLPERVALLNNTAEQQAAMVRKTGGTAYHVYGLEVASVLLWSVSRKDAL